MENIISYFGEYTAGVDGALSTFKFEYLTTLGFAAIVIFVGRWIVAHSAPLRKYAIPAPVVSGLIFSIVISCIKGAGIVGLSFDVKIMKDFCQNIFFLAVGYGFSASLLKKAGARVVLGLDDLLTAPVNGSGYNPQYGLLGSNKADDTRVKLFPRDADVVAKAIGQRLSEATGKRIEAMVYGDGAFKDPVGKIWELADPVVSPAYTAGLVGTPNELKLKYLADNDFADLSGEALKQAISTYIKNKPRELKGTMATQGTTPRRITDLLGSLCDLTTGSGDKGTPIVLIQGYFDNYTD